LDNHEHRKLIRKIASRPGVKLVIVDSLSGGHRRDENSTSMLELVKFLAIMARDLNIPVLLIHHLRKKGLLEDNTVEIDRLRGSSTIVQTARVIWALDKPNSNDEHLRLRVIKSNIAKEPNPIGCQVDDKGVHFGETPKPISRMSAVDEAAEFLLSFFSDFSDESVEVQKVYEKAAEFGIQKRTLNTAKRQLGIRSRKERGKNGKWYWELP
jgi:hypothetical protein